MDKDIIATDKIVLIPEAYSADQITLSSKACEVLAEELTRSKEFCDTLGMSHRIVFYLASDTQCRPFVIKVVPEERSRRDTTYLALKLRLDEFCRIPMGRLTPGVQTVFGLRVQKIPKVIGLSILILFVVNLIQLIIGSLTFSAFSQLVIYSSGMFFFMGAMIWLLHMREAPSYACAARLCDLIRKKTPEELMTSSDALERWIGNRLAKTS